MNRRQLITSALQAGAASVLAPVRTSAQPVDDRLVSQRANSCVPDELIGEAAVANYFTEEALQKALGTAKLDKPRDVQVIAFNFPSWHPSPYMEKLFGKGWTEWDTLKNAHALFPGHSMPHYPLWGYYDEADPEWAAKEVELASTYGVDAWMIDWYWHEGLQFYHEQLERGLLKSENRSKIKFAIMWANHDWKNVYPAHSPDAAATLLPQTHSIKDFENVANYCAEHYFSSRITSLSREHRSLQSSIRVRLLSIWGRTGCGAAWPLCASACKSWVSRSCIFRSVTTLTPTWGGCRNWDLIARRSTVPWHGPTEGSRRAREFLMASAPGRRSPFGRERKQR